MLRIFLLRAEKPVGYDCFYAFVVVARDEASARKLAAEVSADEGSEMWLNETNSSVLSFGTADPDVGEKIVSGSFNAG